LMNWLMKLNNKWVFYEVERKWDYDRVIKIYFFKFLDILWDSNSNNIDW
jgi:hypothetical protein